MDKWKWSYVSNVPTVLTVVITTLIKYKWFLGDIFLILFIFNEFFIGSFFDRFKCFIVEKKSCVQTSKIKEKSCSRGTTWKLNCVIVKHPEKMKPNYIPCTSANYLPHSLEALLGQQEWWGSRMVLQISVNLF